MRRVGSDSALSVMQDSFRDMRADYRMASTGPHRKERRGLPPNGASADWHGRVEIDYYKMLERAREIRINDPIIGKAIQRLTTNIVQDGFMPDPQSGDIEADAVLRELWCEWAEMPETQRFHTWNGCERLSFSSAISDGDIKALVTDDDGIGRLQFMEAHLCQTPTSSAFPGLKERQAVVNSNIVLGVELNAQRVRQAYWFAVDDINPQRSSLGKPTRVPAIDADGNLQVFDIVFPDRMTQTRGLPAIQSVDDFVTYHDDIQFAQLVKQQVSTCYAIFEELTAGSVPGVGRGANEQVETFSDGVDRYTDELYPGKFYRGRPGAKLQGFSPNVPNAEYFQHVMMMLSIIAVNLDLPVAVLMLDPSQSNYSSWRGSLDQAKQRWKDLQRMLCERLHFPTWCWKVREWTQNNKFLQRAAKKGLDLCEVNWRIPAWPYIDPYKDAQADDYIVTTLQNSRRRVMASRGLQLEIVAPEIVEDNYQFIRLAKIKAKQINDEFPGEEQVRWQELLALPLPKNISIAWSDPGVQNGNQPSQSK